MLYSTIVQRDETGFNEMYEAAREFTSQNALEAILDCKFSKKKIEQTLNLVRMYQSRLNIESMDLVEFSETFIEEYATDHNECFRLTEKLIKRIGSTLTGSMKLFRQFCPVIRRKIDGAGNIVPTLDYTRLRFHHFYGQFFGTEVYIEAVKTLLFELAAFFYHLVTTMKVCKDMIQKEEEVMGDIDRLKEIFEKSCDEALKSVHDVFSTFGEVKLVSEEELEERRKHARPMKEWLPKDYHAHDKKWMQHEALVYRYASGRHFGLDEEASILWAKNPEWGNQVCDIIPKLDTLNLSYKNSKKAIAQGKIGTFDVREMVYLIKWSGVSWMSPDGKQVLNEAFERRFYRYLERKYNGQYLLPSWQAVCKERRYCYEKNFTMQKMASKFSAHLQQQSDVA